MTSPYLQCPTLSEQSIAFVHGDTLWIAPATGGTPRRMTDGKDSIRRSAFSPDGQSIAFVSNGDVHIALLNGYIPKRLTFVQSNMRIIQWNRPDHIIIASQHNSPFRQNALYRVDIHTGQMTALDIGPCEWIDQEHKVRVIQRHGYGYTSWKGYKGGMAGQMWVDVQGNGQFCRIMQSYQNTLIHPCIINSRIYFLSDLSGTGNIHSCTLDGQDIQQHTHHTGLYARDLTRWQHTLIYSRGGQILTCDTRTLTEKTVPITLNIDNIGQHSVQHSPSAFLNGYAPTSDGKKIALVTRGRLFEGTPHKGPMFQRGKANGVRYRWATWLADQSLVTLCDQGHKEELNIFSDHGDCVTAHTEKDFKTDWGRLVTVKAHPYQRKLACTNHRHDIIIIDFDTQESFFVARSQKSPVHGYDWSPCGTWLTYSISNTLRGAHIGLYHTIDKTNHSVTNEEFLNTCPVFSRDGSALFFLSNRTLDPEWDDMSLGMSCYDTTQPFAITLEKNTESPFVKPLIHDEADVDKKDENDQQKTEKQNPEAIKIDLDGIEKRIVAFPLPPRAYSHIAAVKGHLLYTVNGDKIELHSYDLSSLREELWLSDIDSMALSMNHEWMMYTSNKKLRLVKADTKPDDNTDTSFKQGGWLDWNRISLKVIPQKEWRQMFDEAWRLQKDMFWMPSMGNVNWQEVYDRYRPCIDQASCLSEVEDIIGDMQGELGTSHAYVMQPQKKKNHSITLGASLDFVPEKGVYRIGHIIQGDPWTSLPLQRPGLKVKTGDLLWSVSGHNLSSTVHPLDILQGQSGNGVPLVISDPDGQNKRSVVVFPKAKSREKEWLYRQWISKNRAWVHEKSQGRAGYIHIPDMQSKGYGEFLRGYLQEFDRPGLMIDARYNGGGNISYLILDLLTRRRLGYDQSRHQGSFGYPSDAPHGPMVALVNEHTGSDGDIFAHAFKALNLGPVVGKRTWGGVVGIWPRYSLIDGTMTTQPEYSFWFHDEGWTVENKGVDPTIDVEITPQDAASNIDTQMQHGLDALEAIIKNHDSKSNAPPLPCLKRNKG